MKIMKKYAAALSAVLCLSFAAGCACQAEVSTESAVPFTTAEQPTVKETPETAAPVQTTAAVPETTVAVRDMTVSIETFAEKENILITYPSLSGLKDASQETFWNDFFFEDARAAAEGLAEGTALTCTWEAVSGSARILSLVKKTEMTAPGAAYPTVNLKAYNLDSVTGSAIRLSQICDTNAIAKDLAEADQAAADGGKNTAYTISAPDGTDVTDLVTMADLLELNGAFTTGPNSKDTKTALTRLLNCMDYDGDNEVSGYTYWKDSVLHLVFPYIHSVGDYIDIQVKDAHRSSSTK